MDEENKKENENEFGKVIDALHQKSKLSSLRTYHGDMAEFIKEKNESTISINLKEKERKEERAKENNLIPVEKKKTDSGFKMNFVTLVSSLVLLGLGGTAAFYAFNSWQNTTPVVLPIANQIVPFSNLAIIFNANAQNFGSKVNEADLVSGVNVFSVSMDENTNVEKISDLLNLLEISVPKNLLRTLKNQYVVGAVLNENQKYPFLVITVGDFGQAFSAMLEWEPNMEKDLGFLNASDLTSKKGENFVWKDLIVKNKDTRSLANERNQAKLAYTFLDKNTILITNDLFALNLITNAYVSKQVAR